MAEQSSALAATAAPVPSVAIAVDKGIRVAGYLIDVVPAIVLGLFCLIPIVGPIIAGLLLAPYWLLRDAAGASFGKLVLGSRIALKNGEPATIGTRVLRNLPLAIGPAFLIIPVLGYFLGPLIAGTAVLVECILLMRIGERLGDKIAGTIVVKK